MRRRRAARVIPMRAAAMSGEQPHVPAQSPGTRDALTAFLSWRPGPFSPLPEIPGHVVELEPERRVPSSVEFVPEVYEARLRRIAAICEDGRGQAKHRFWFIAELLAEWEWHDSHVASEPLRDLQPKPKPHIAAAPDAAAKRPRLALDLTAAEPAAVGELRQRGSTQTLDGATSSGSAAAAEQAPTMSYSDTAAWLEPQTAAALEKRAEKRKDQQQEAAGSMEDEVFASTRQL